MCHLLALCFKVTSNENSTKSMQVDPQIMIFITISSHYDFSTMEFFFHIYGQSNLE